MSVFLFERFSALIFFKIGYSYLIWFILYRFNYIFYLLAES